MRVSFVDASSKFSGKTGPMQSSSSVPSVTPAKGKKMRRRVWDIGVDRNEARPPGPFVIGAKLEMTLQIKECSVELFGEVLGLLGNVA
jgi:hypothetical protein